MLLLPAVLRQPCNCRDSYLGVTPPISTNESTPREKEVTLTLMEELRRQKTFESEEEAKTRCVASLLL